MSLTGWCPDRVLYVGDHVYTDLAVSIVATLSQLPLTVCARGGYSSGTLTSNSNHSFRSSCNHVTVHLCLRGKRRSSCENGCVMIYLILDLICIMSAVGMI